VIKIKTKYINECKNKTKRKGKIYNSVFTEKYWFTAYLINMRFSLYPNIFIIYLKNLSNIGNIVVCFA